MIMTHELHVRAICEHEDDWKTQVNEIVASLCGSRVHIRKTRRTGNASKKFRVRTKARCHESDCTKSDHRFLPFFDILLACLTPDFRQIAV